MEQQLEQQLVNLCYSDEFRKIYNDYCDATFSFQRSKGNKELAEKQAVKAKKMLEKIGIKVNTIKVGSNGIEFTTDTQKIKVKKAISICDL